MRILFITLLGLISIFLLQRLTQPVNIISGAPPDGIPESEVPSFDMTGLFNQWKRPPGPPRVGVQVGHWQNDQVPEELKNLRNNTGASSPEVTELELNLAIANKLVKKLEAKGYSVDLIPTTVPPDYLADVFIAIHSDGNTDPSVRGYKFAGPWRDLSRKSSALVEILNQDYGNFSNLPYDPNISRNMRGYYAFAWWKFDHSIHPMTTAVIAELGFVTNPQDRQFLISSQDQIASSLAASIEKFIQRHVTLN